MWGIHLVHLTSDNHAKDMDKLAFNYYDEKASLSVKFTPFTADVSLHKYYISNTVLCYYREKIFRQKCRNVSYRSSLLG